METARQAEIGWQSERIAPSHAGFARCWITGRSLPPVEYPSSHSYRPGYGPLESAPMARRPSSRKWSVQLPLPGWCKGRTCHLSWCNQRRITRFDGWSERSSGADITRMRMGALLLPSAHSVCIHHLPE